MEKIVGSRVLHAGHRFTVRELEIELAPGKTVRWEVVDKGANSVSIVPVDESGNVYLVEEYFAAINERALCLPKGMVNKGETDKEAAQRELQEEIGMKGNLRHLVTMSVSPGYLTQRTILFLATRLEMSELPRDEEHYLRVVRLPMCEVVEKIRLGLITEARTIGGIMLAKLELGM